MFIRIYPTPGPRILRPKVRLPSFIPNRHDPQHHVSRYTRSAHPVDGYGDGAHGVYFHGFRDYRCISHQTSLGIFPLYSPGALVLSIPIPKGPEEHSARLLAHNERRWRSCIPVLWKLHWGKHAFSSRFREPGARVPLLIRVLLVVHGLESAFYAPLSESQHMVTDFLVVLHVCLVGFCQCALQNRPHSKCAPAS